MQITLRKFLEITGMDIIQEYCCELRVDTYDETFEYYAPKRISFGEKGSHGEYWLKDIKNLDPYMDYEIYQFAQEYEYGEIVYQGICLRKI